ncbi:hypothetical protein A8709_07955 [Paenibacillus pectinilyticus]|uniref:Bacterial Ig-like domain-containing protein n=1 Tax=Paenibacillus pectinilyticus TaxID=512399 RepID=A0A1C1A7M1_9BACL|nr:immunoglobulin-like domain-containing protein [Paenibacillus pectinilyticus]OCT16602.1 hypothetical protein A8709_07955 [Paenibacillus pectinilyticus]
MRPFNAKILYASLLIVIFLSGCGSNQASKNVFMAPTVSSKVEASEVIQNNKYSSDFNITIDKSSYGNKETMQMQVTNNSSYTIMTGEFLIIQKFENAKWYTLTLSNLAFAAVGYQLQSGESRSMQVGLLQWLPKGTYRLIKEISFDDSGKNVSVGISTPEFELK